MSDESFRLPKSSYEELAKIIAAYSQANADAVTLAEVTKLAGIHVTRVSANSAFLTSVGLIGGGKKKSPSELCVRLGSALVHKIQAEIAKAWSEVVTGNAFLSKMVLAVRIRNSMDRSALESHVAFSAGERKSPESMAGARAIVEILIQSGLLREGDDGLITVNEPSLEAPPSDAVSEPPHSPIAAAKETVTANLMSGVTVSIQVQVNATPGELGTLGANLRRLLDDLRRPGDEQTNPHEPASNS